MRREKARLFKDFHRGQDCRTLSAEFFTPPKNLAVPQCRCVTRAGESKNLYATIAEAQFNADYSRAKTGIKLRVYECPENAGYHLTRG